MSEASVREILRQLGEMHERLERIEQRVAETNGRVKALELAKAFRDGGRAAMSWAQPLLIAIVSGIVVGLVLLVAQA